MGDWNPAGLFVPSFDTYMIILLDNLYAGVTLISKNKKQSVMGQ